MPFWTIVYITKLDLYLNRNIYCSPEGKTNFSKRILQTPQWLFRNTVNCTFFASIPIFFTWYDLVTPSSKGLHSLFEIIEAECRLKTPNDSYEEAEIVEGYEY